MSKGNKKSAIEGKLNKEINSYIRKTNFDIHYFEEKESITYSDFLSNKMLIVAAINAGIPYSLFSLIQDYTPFSEGDWAEYLDLSTKSLQRYKSSSSHLFKPMHSEKIIELAEVTKLGIDVFGDMDKFKLWLYTPNFALGNMNPIDLLKSSYGKELIMTELVHINHGILI